MTKNINLYPYTINSFGYFKRNEETPAFPYTLKELLEQLIEFRHGKKLVDTQTFEPTKDSYSSLHHTYLADVVKISTDSYILVLWLKSFLVEGKHGYLDENCTEGNIHIEAEDVKSGYIPGYPSYHLFNTANNTMSNILFDSGPFNNNELQFYIQNFLKYFSPFRIHAYGDDKKIIGYKRNDEDETCRGYPRFWISPSVTDYIDTKVIPYRRHITHIESKVRLSLRRDQDKKLLNFLRGLVSYNPESEPEKKEIRYKIPVGERGLNKSEIEKIRDDFASKDSDYDDIGFKLKSNPTPIWLSGSREKITISGVHLPEVMNINKVINDLKERLSGV